MGDFEFVVQSQDVYKDGFTKETRTRIRKQAMKKIGAERRRTGAYGKHNLRQHPVMVQEVLYDPVPSSNAVLPCPDRAPDPPAVTESARDEAAVDGELELEVDEEEADGILAPVPPARLTRTRLQLTHAALSSSSSSSSSSFSSLPVYFASYTAAAAVPFATAAAIDEFSPLPARMPLAGLDRLVAEFGINPVHFAALTNVHLGGVAAAVLSRQPQRLTGLLANGQCWSYFMFVPARYGHHPFLDDSLRCLVVKARAMLAPSAEADKAILSAYGKALTSLQKAVLDPRMAFAPDVLGATGILSVFELLNGSSPKAWSAHIMGASRLIQLRGPANIESEYEKALIISLSGPIVCEAMVNNQRCFLEDVAWQKALTSTVIPDVPFAPRSHLGIFLGCQMTKMPGLFRDVTHAVCQRETISSVALEALICRGLELQKYLQECRTKFDDLVKADERAIAAAGGKAGAGVSDRGARFEILGLTLTVSVIVYRLLGAVWPSHRDSLEDQCVAMAKELRELDDNVSQGNAKVSFYLAQKNRIMDSTMRTTSLWRDREGEEGNIIEKWKFDAWCNAIPRKTCDGKQCQPKKPLVSFVDL